MRSTSALVSVALLCSSGIAVAQHAPVTWRATAKNAVYVELLGNGGLLSYNVDRKLNQTVTARFAYGKFSSIELGDQPTESYQTFTAMINALAGGPVWWFESGVGLMTGTYRVEEWAHSEKPLLDVTSTIGLRRQPLGGGLVLRVGLIPRYVIWGDKGGYGLTFRGGVSAGLAF